MIILRHVSKNYTTALGTVPALSDINLHVLPGEICGIIGKSGAGKSTLIRCANLLETPTTGDILINGENLQALSPQQLRLARHKIGMIFQHFNLLSSRTVFDNIAFPLELIGYSRPKQEKIIMPLLELTGLADKKNTYPSQLSGGQKQRVAIARALTSQPHVLLCDEATSALDPETTQAILQLLKNIRDTLNVSILLITHEMSVIKNCCDRVGILENGKLIETNTVGDFFAYPKTDSAKRFVASTFAVELPAALQQTLLSKPSTHTHPLICFYFLPNTAAEPIITRLINQFSLQVNILQANVEYIQNHLLGAMTMAIHGNPDHIAAALAYVNSLGIRSEILGYVRNDVISFT
jgi:D-methionine transport system ATP-binding protein